MVVVMPVVCVWWSWSGVPGGGCLNKAARGSQARCALAGGTVIQLSGLLASV